MELKKDFVFHLCSSKRNQPPADFCKWLILCCRGDWIRTSDHTPPELNFTFSNKFNELYFNVFAYLSTSCDLPSSGVVAISRVPPVFQIKT